jgi:hypothetical protein
MLFFVYLPLVPAIHTVAIIPFEIYSYILESVIPCCIFMFRRGEQATSTEIIPHAVILKE